MTVMWNKSSYSLSNGHCVEIGWFKSSRSEANGACVEIGIEKPEFFKSSRSADSGACVEVADARDVIFVRDTKNRDQGMLEFSRHAFNDFVQAIKSGEFDK